MSKAVDVKACVKMTTLTSRKKSEAETVTAQISERIDGVLEGDDFPAVPPAYAASQQQSLSSVFAGSDSPGPRQA